MPVFEIEVHDEELFREYAASHLSGIEKWGGRVIVAKPRAYSRLAVGALAVGAMACGALAIGALAISRLAVRRASVGHMQIEELHIRRLRVENQQSS
jgi:hypothetical protein